MTVIQNVIARLSNVTCVTNYRYNIVNRISTSVFQYTPKQSVEEKLGIKPRPKRPYTPFLRFSLQQRTSVIQQNPQANQKDILKLIAEEWKNVDESVKSQLQAQFKKEWLKYLEDCKEYDKLLSPVDREEIAKAKEEAKTVKEKRILRKTKKDLGCPKKPGSSYVYFMKSKLPERGDTPFKEFQQKIKAEWEKLPELQKDRFEQLYKKDMEDYREKMSLWTKKMNEEGHSFSTKKQRVGPKRPASSYFHFLRSKLLHRGETPFKEYQKKVREEWEKLPPNEKKKYEDMYKREMEEYKTLKADWSEGQKAKTGVRRQ